MSKLLKWVDKIIVIFSLLYYTGTLNFLGGITIADDPALKRTEPTEGAVLSMIQLLLYAATLLMTGARYKQILYVASKRKVFWGFVAVILLSFLWSQVPDITMRRAVVFLGVTLLGLNISVRYTIREQLFLLAWTMGIMVLINLVFTLGFPWAAIEAGEHQGAWRGVYAQKNILGRNTVLSAIIFLLAAMESRPHRTILWGGLGLSVLLILLSGSKGALVVFLVLLALIPLFSALRSSNSLVLPLLIIGILVGGSIATLLIGNTETIVKFLGRDLTLTGRTGIWSVVISKIAQHPWLGYGYKSFWRGMDGDSADVWYETLFMAPNSHNGFLDLLVDLGIIGCSCFILSFIKNCDRAIVWLRLDPTAAGLLPIMYLMFMFLYNLTESTILDPAIFVLLLYPAITTSVLTQPIAIKTSASPESTIHPSGV